MQPSQLKPVQRQSRMQHERSCPLLSHAEQSSTNSQHVDVNRPQAQQWSVERPGSSLHDISLPASGRDSPTQQQSQGADHAVHGCQLGQQTQPAWHGLNSTAESQAEGSLIDIVNASSPKELAWESTIQTAPEKASPHQGDACSAIKPTVEKS